MRALWERTNPEKMSGFHESISQGGTMIECNTFLINEGAAYVTISSG